MTPLRTELKDVAENVFHYNERLSEMSLDDREEAAQWYEDFAAEVGGVLWDLARLYNLERAKFLRGQVARIAYNAPAFAKEIGYIRRGDMT